MTEQMSDLKTLEATLMAEIEAAGDEAAIEAVRVSALGKKGSISERLKTLGAMSADEAAGGRPRHQRAEDPHHGRDYVPQVRAARPGDRGAACRREGRRDAAGAPVAGRGAAASIRSARSSTRSPPSSRIWAFRSPKVPTSRPTTTISRR